MNDGILSGVISFPGTLTIRQPKPVMHAHDACGGEVFAVALLREYDMVGFQPTGQTAWMCPACGVFVQPAAPITKKAAAL